MCVCVCVVMYVCVWLMHSHRRETTVYLEGFMCKKCSTTDTCFSLSNASGASISSYPVTKHKLPVAAAQCAS